MSDLSEKIENLLRYGETVGLECKKATGGLPKSIWETYSAFANTHGGVILLGIEENLEEANREKRFTIRGIDNPEKLIKSFWDTLNSDKVNVSVLVDADVQVVSYCGKTLIYVHVPPASYRQRPVFLNGNPMKGTYKRNYEGDYHCTEDEVRAMLRDSNDSGNDGTLLENYTFDDIDLETLKAYRNEYQIKNPDHIWNTIDNKEFLRRLGGLSINRHTGKEWLTIAGLLMFGKGLSVCERLDNIRMDYLDLTNLPPNSRWSDRLTYDGTWENNLYTFFRKTMPKLTSNLKRPFILDGIVRVDDTPVHKAIREAMVNLIIHCDFMITGVLRVEKRDNCFVFINPGNLKLPLQEIYKGGTSKARNPRIQTMLRMLGLGENIGSGFPTILDAWKKENWRRPDLFDNADLKQVELRLWTVSFISEESTRYMHQHFKDSYDQLSANEQIILCTTFNEQMISNSRLQSVLDMHPVEIGKILSGLVNDGFLKRLSNGRWTTYVLNIEESEIADNDLGTTQVPPKYHPSTTQVPPKYHPSTTQVKRLLLILGNEVLSAPELMLKFGLKNRRNFGKNYLAPALKAGLIEMTDPEHPNSPKQKYRRIQE